MLRNFLFDHTVSIPKTTLRAEQLEARDVPSVAGMESVFTQPPMTGNSAHSAVDVQAPAPATFSANPLASQARARFAVGTDGGSTAQVNVYDAQSNALVGIVNPFGMNYKGSISVATGDVTGDGIEDIVVAAGQGSTPMVKVFDGTTLQERVSFLAYSKTFRGGVTVAVGDVNGDGRADVVVGAGIGSAPQIKVFSGKELFALPGSIGNTTPRTIHNFMAFDRSNRAGVSVAVGNVNGDGYADIIVGTGRGVAGQVKAFNGQNSKVLLDFSLGGAGYTGGVNVAAGDMTGDGKAEIFAGQASGGSQIWVFDAGSQIATYSAFSNSNGVRLGTEDINGDGKVELLTSVANGAPRVRILDGATGAVKRDFPGFLPMYSKGLVVG